MSVFHLAVDASHAAAPQEQVAMRPEVEALLNGYLEVTRAASDEPFLSLKPLFRFYGMAFAWEISLIFLPVVGLVNAIIFLVARIRRSVPRYVPAWALSSTARAWRSLHAGEVPLLKFVVNRNLVRLFVLLHARARMRDLINGERGAYLASKLTHDDAGAIQAEMDRHALEAATSVLGQRAELKFVLLMLPVVELFTGALGSFAKALKLPLRQLAANVSAALTFGTWSSDLALQRVLMFGTVVVYLLMIVVSCFIRKRELFLEHHIYDLEHAAATAVGSPVRRECPLDLVGWLVLVALLLLPSAVTSRQDWTPVVVLMIVYVTPLAYACIRRFMLRRCFNVRRQLRYGRLGTPAPALT